MIQKGEYKPFSLSEHILQNIKEDLNNAKIPNIIWSKLRLFSGEMIKKPSLFLQKVCVNDMKSYNPKDIEYEVWKYYYHMFSESEAETRKCEKEIEYIFRNYVNIKIIEETFNYENILKATGQMSGNITGGPDFIHPRLLEDIELCNLFANKINHILKKNNWLIPE